MEKSSDRRALVYCDIIKLLMIIKEKKILRMFALLDPIIEEEKMEVFQWFAFEAEISS